MRKPTQSEIINDVVWAVFEGKISFDDPNKTAEEVKEYINKLKSGETEYTQSLFDK